MSRDEPPLTLVRYAEALATLRGYAAELHDALLGRLGVSQQSVADSGAYWGGEIAASLARGDAAALLAFARAYGHVERRVRLYHPPVDKVKPDPGLREFVRPSAQRRDAVGPATMSSQSPSQQRLPSEPAPMVTPTSAVPSYLQVANTIDPDKTATVDAASVQRGQKLPFESESTSAQLARLREEYAVANRSTARAAAKEEAKEIAKALGGHALGSMAGTVSLPHGIPTGPSTPFEQRRSAELQGPALTLERYAEITVALGSSDDREGVLRSFGLTDVTWASSATSWGARIMGNPKLRTAFDEAVLRARGRR